MFGTELGPPFHPPLSFSRRGVSLNDCVIAGSILFPFFSFVLFLRFLFPLSFLFPSLLLRLCAADLRWDPFLETSIRVEEFNSILYKFT